MERLVDHILNSIVSIKSSGTEFFMVDDIVALGPEGEREDEEERARGGHLFLLNYASGSVARLAQHGR